MVVLNQEIILPSVIMQAEKDLRETMLIVNFFAIYDGKTAFDTNIWYKTKKQRTKFLSDQAASRASRAGHVLGPTTGSDTVLWMGLRPDLQQISLVPPLASVPFVA